MRSLLLGIDVSPRRLGWGLVDLVSGAAVACGCEAIDLPDYAWGHERVQGALRVVADAYRCATCHGSGQVATSWGTAEHGGGSAGRCPDCDVLGKDGEVQAVYVEQPWLSPKSGTKVAYNAGRAVQAAHTEVERRWPWVTVEYLQPQEWRKLAGVPHKGKPPIVARAVELGFTPGEQDAADAACIAVAGQRRNDETWTRGSEVAA